MHPYPRCPSCGRLLTPFYRLYHEKDQANTAALADEGILPEYARVNTTIGVHTNHIFDEIGVKTICCRATIRTGTYFRVDVYGQLAAQPGDHPRASKYIMRPKNEK